MAPLVTTIRWSTDERVTQTRRALGRMSPNDGISGTSPSQRPTGRSGAQQRRSVLNRVRMTVIAAPPLSGASDLKILRYIDECTGRILHGRGGGGRKCTAGSTQLANSPSPVTTSNAVVSPR